MQNTQLLNQAEFPQIPKVILEPDLQFQITGFSHAQLVDLARLYYRWSKQLYALLRIVHGSCVKPGERRRAPRRRLPAMRPVFARNRISADFVVQKLAATVSRWR